MIIYFFYVLFSFIWSHLVRVTSRAVAVAAVPAADIDDDVGALLLLVSAITRSVEIPATMNFIFLKYICVFLFKKKINKQIKNRVLVREKENKPKSTLDV